MSQQTKTTTEKREEEIRKAAIREGIRLERSRVIAMMFSNEWRHEPCQDIAGLIMNGMHWEEVGNG